MGGRGPPPAAGGRRGGARPTDAVVRYTKRLNREYAERGDVDGAKQLIEAMLSEGVAPTLCTMNTLIKCYRNARRPEGAEATLHDLSRWGLAPDGCSYCTVIDAWGLAGKPDSAKRVLAEAEAQGTCDARTYSALMRFVPWQEVETLMQRMVCLSVAPDLATCNAALNTLATAGQPEAALQFVQRYMRSAAPPGSRQELSPVQLSLPAPDQRTYSILLKAFCMCGKAAQAESMLRLMLTHGYPLNVPAFSTVMNALVSARPPNVNAAEALMRDAEAHGLKPDTQMYNLLIKGYASSVPPNPEAARSILERIVAAGLVPSIASLTSVMDAFCEANDVDAAASLARTFSEQHGIRLTEPVYNVLIKGYARCRCKRTTGVCHCVTCTCCQPLAGMKIVEEMAKRGLAPDAVTFNTLIDAHCNAGLLSSAWLLLKSVCLACGGRMLSASAVAHRSAPAQLSPGALHPNLTSFRTAFRAMARCVADGRFTRSGGGHPSLGAGHDVDRCCGAGIGRRGGCSEPPSAQPIPTRLELVQLFADGLGLLLGTLGPLMDESLSSTLVVLGRSLIPGWTGGATVTASAGGAGGTLLSESETLGLLAAAEEELRVNASMPTAGMDRTPHALQMQSSVPYVHGDVGMRAAAGLSMTPTPALAAAPQALPTFSQNQMNAHSYLNHFGQYHQFQTPLPSQYPGLHAAQQYAPGQGLPDASVGLQAPVHQYLPHPTNAPSWPIFPPSADVFAPSSSEAQWLSGALERQSALPLTGLKPDRAPFLNAPVLDGLRETAQPDLVESPFAVAERMVASIDAAVESASMHPPSATETPADAAGVATDTADSAASVDPSAPFITLRIDGLRCGGCVRSVTEALASLPAVVSTTVDLGTGEAKIQVVRHAAGHEAVASVDAIVATVTSLGFPTQVVGPLVQPPTMSGALSAGGDQSQGVAGCCLSSPPSVQTPDALVTSEVLQLRRRIEELESQLASHGLGAAGNAHCQPLLEASNISQA